MHISEGVLNSEILITGTVASTALLAYSIKSIDSENIPKIAVLSAVFFLASFIHVPIGVASIHLILGGLVGAFLGYGAFLAIFVALSLQGLLFGYGGITTLGVNSFIMGVPALLGYYILKIRTTSKTLQNILYFLVGFIPTFVSAFLLSLVLALNGDKFLNTSYLAFISNLPIMLIEGLITLFAINFIQKISPTLLKE